MCKEIRSERNLRGDEDFFPVNAKCPCALLSSEEVDVNSTTIFCDAPDGNH